MVRFFPEKITSAPRTEKDWWIHDTSIVDGWSGYSYPIKIARPLEYHSFFRSCLEFKVRATNRKTFIPRVIVKDRLASLLVNDNIKDGLENHSWLVSNLFITLEKFKTLLKEGDVIHSTPLLAAYSDSAYQKALLLLEHFFPEYEVCVWGRASKQMQKFIKE